MQWIAQLTTRQVFAASLAWITTVVLLVCRFVFAMLKRIHGSELRGFNFTSVSVEPIRAALLLSGPPLGLIVLRTIARWMLGAGVNADGTNT